MAPKTISGFNRRDNTTMKTSGWEQLDANLQTMEDKVKRKITRRVVTVSGNNLAKVIRKNAKVMFSGEARSRMSKKNAQARTSNSSLGLARHIISRFWSAPRKGVMGTAVGGSWPQGAHAHLVEFGHEIVVRKKRRGIGRAFGAVSKVRTGKRTRPIPFQRKAEEAYAARAVIDQAQTFRQEMSKVNLGKFNHGKLR